MISTSGIGDIPVYGSAAAYYRQFPTDEQVAAGVVPLDSLPAGWWNAMWYCYSCRWNETRSAVNSLVDEVCNAIACSGITLSSNCNSQLYQAIKQYGTASQAGAVKSSSTDGKVSIDSNGIMSLNGYGNAALQTTAQTLTGAINELKDRIDNFVGVTYSDTAPLVNGTAAAGTSDTAARGDHVHPIGCCIQYTCSTNTLARILSYHFDSSSGSNSMIACGPIGGNLLLTSGCNGLSQLMACGVCGVNRLVALGCCSYNLLCSCGARGYNLIWTNGINGYNSILACGNNGYNQISADGNNGYNVIKAEGIDGYNELRAGGDRGHNTLFVENVYGANNLCATGNNGSNNLYATGCCGYNFIQTEGRYGYNIIEACGYQGYNAVCAWGQCGFNTLYTDGTYGYNEMRAEGSCGDNRLTACRYNQFTAGLCNIVCTYHASCDTYTCISTQGHEATLGFYTCGSSEAHFSHHVTEGQVNVYSCADAVGSDGTYIIRTCYAQGCAAYMCMSASNSDSSICVCSHSYSNCANTQVHWARDYNPEITEDGPSYTIKAESYRTRACCWCADCNCWSRWSPRIYLCASGSDTPPAAGTYASGVATLGMFATRPNNLYTAGDGETLDGNRLEQVGITCLYGNKLYIGVGPIPAASCCCATPASCYNVGDEVVIDLNQWMVPNNCTYPPTLKVRGGAVQAIHHLDAVCVKYCCTGTQSTSCYCYDLYIQETGSSGIGAYANRACLRFFNMQRSALWPAPAAGTGWTFTGTSITGPASSSGTCTLEKGLMMYDAW